MGLFLKPLKAMDGFQERHGCEQRVLKITPSPQFKTVFKKRTPHWKLLTYLKPG